MKKTMKKYSLILLGTLLFAISVNLFTLPAKIVTGGVSGIATIMYHTLGLSPGLVIGILNVLIGLAALIVLGKKFVMDSLLGIVAIPLFIELTSFLPPATNDLFLASVFGGIISGVGIGLTFSQGGTTGGTDIISRISQKKFPHLSIGVLLTIVDLMIICVSYIFFGDLELSMYGIITLVVSTAMIDAIISRLNSGVLVYIISDKTKELKETIFTYLQRGLTIIDGYGGYNANKKEVIMCVMKRKEAQTLKKHLDIIAPYAFVIMTPSKEVLGEGFRYYK